MKVALVHDYLNQIGGGERVLQQLMKMFPEAPIYTLLYDQKKTLGMYELPPLRHPEAEGSPAGHSISRVKGTSFLDFQFARNHHRLFIPLMPLAARKMDLGSEYDLIISDSAGFGKGITYDRAKTKHLCYVHTPLRYAWETETYFGHSFAAVAFTSIFKPAFNYVRNFDYQAGQKPDMLLANSQYIAEKIKNYYDREAEVVYPPVDFTRFFYDPSPSVVPIPSVIASTRRLTTPSLVTTVTGSNPSPLSFRSTHPESMSPGSRVPSADGPRMTDAAGEYFLAAGRLLHYKRFDLIIDTFNKLGLPLKIVGTGPEEKKLRAQASRLSLRVPEAIQFLGFIKSDEELRKLYSGAKAFIMANEEDFGLVTAEAQACGTPVIAYGAGGSLEIVEPRVTGMFFQEQTIESLTKTIEEFERIKFDRQAISEKAKRFSVENFEKGIKVAVAQLL